MSNTPEKIIEFELINFNPLIVRIISTLITIKAVIETYIAYRFNMYNVGTWCLHSGIKAILALIVGIALIIQIFSILNIHPKYTVLTCEILIESILTCVIMLWISYAVLNVITVGLFTSFILKL